MLPYFYERAQHPQAPEILGKFALKYFAFFGLGSLFTFVIARPLVLIAADAKFHDAVTYIPMIILAGWLNINFNIYYWSLMYSKKTSVISTLVGISAGLMVGLLFLFLQEMQLGIQGVVYALVIVALFKNVAGHFLSQRYLKLRVDILKIAASFLAIVLAGLVIHLAPEGSVLGLDIFVKIVIFSLCFLLVQKVSNISLLNKKLLFWR
jgi:O-antigen/teichoic acid export membrane protein